MQAVLPFLFQTGAIMVIAMLTFGVVRVALARRKYVPSLDGNTRITWKSHSTG